MTKKEVLKHLDELVHPMMQSKHQWTTDEAIAMQVQTFRTYRLVAEHNGVHESTVKRMCERVILSFETKGILKAYKKFGWDGRCTSLDPSINQVK
jgi:hypothetical protein